MSDTEPKFVLRKPQEPKTVLVPRKVAEKAERNLKLKAWRAEQAKTERSSDNKWLGPGLDRLGSGAIRYRWRDADGQQHSATVDSPGRNQPGDTKARDEARRLLAIEKGKVASGTALKVNKSTVVDFASAWNAARPNRLSSQKARASNLKLLEKAPLGDMPIQDVRASDIQTFVRWMIDQGHTGSTVRQRYKWLRAVFTSAVDDQVLQHSPCVRISLPEVSKDESEPLTVDQINNLADAIKAEYRMVVLLQGGCGLRVSEALGLVVDSVSGTNLKVSQQLLENGNYGPLKTAGSARVVPIPKGLQADVDKLVEGKTAGLFPNKIGKPTRKDTYNIAFRKAVEACEDVPDETTTHDLRHAFGAHLLMAGVPAHVVARSMGHNDASMVIKVYSRILNNSADLVKDALDRLW